MLPGMRASATDSWMSDTRCAIGSSADLSGLCTTSTCSSSKRWAARSMTSRCPSVTGSKEPGTTAIRVMGSAYRAYVTISLRDADSSRLAEEGALRVVETSGDRGPQRILRGEGRIGGEQV